MTTIPSIDFFASTGRNTRFAELLVMQKISPVVALQPFVVGDKVQPDTADLFTYIILGLAVLIAIVIPLLNLN